MSPCAHAGYGCGPVGSLGVGLRRGFTDFFGAGPRGGRLPPRLLRRWIRLPPPLLSRLPPRFPPLAIALITPQTRRENITRGGPKRSGGGGFRPALVCYPPYDGSPC